VIVSVSTGRVVVRYVLILAVWLAVAVMAPSTVVVAQQDSGWRGNNFYEIPARWLIDCPTAGTLPRAHWNIVTRIYPGGGAIAHCDIGLSGRLMMGVSYGGEQVLANDDPDWNPRLEFSVKFRFVDEGRTVPGISAGFSSQGNGAFNDGMDRYTFKSRGFYAVVSRSFYFYQWTMGGHGGLNYSLENDGDQEKDLNFFVGTDVTFRYNLALLLEWDAGLNDDRSTLPDGTSNEFGGKGRGYLNASVKWLFTEKLEIELLLKDLFINRRESDTFTRELRITYVDHF
jgi:hypothetical protein